MSYTEFLRTKLASQTKVASVRKPTDASMYIQKQRMSASRVFFQDGTSIGTLTKQTDRPVFNNASVSNKKASGTVPAASDFISFKGSSASSFDTIAQNNVSNRKQLLCVNPTKTPPCPTKWKYPTASSKTMAKVSCPSEFGAEISDVKFVDNTISLSASVPDMILGCKASNNTIITPNHTHSPGIRVDENNQQYAVGKSFFMSNPPMPQAANTSPLKVGTYYTPKSGYVENKQGYVKPTSPVRIASGSQGQAISQLKINKPTLFPIH
jgi:hypothetical protein